MPIARPRPVALLLCLLLGASAAACGARDAEPPPDPEEAALARGSSGWWGTELPAPRARPTVRLVHADGAPFDLAAERGKVVLLFFGYTQCPDVCPMTLARWKKVHAALGPDSSKVRFVFISVDPERDTPEAAAAYARRFDPGIVGLTGRRSEITAIQRQFGVSSFTEVPAGGSAHAHGGHAHTGADSAAASTPDTAGHIASGAGAYTVAHSPRVFVIDRQGEWRLLLPAGAGTRATTGDVRRLLR